MVIVIQTNPKRKAQKIENYYEDDLIAENYFPRKLRLFFTSIVFLKRKEKDKIKSITVEIMMKI